MRALIPIFVVMTAVAGFWDDDSSYYRRPVWSGCAEVKKKGLCLFDGPLSTFGNTHVKSLVRHCCHPSDMEKAFLESKKGVTMWNPNHGYPMLTDTCSVKGKQFCTQCCQVNGNWGNWSPYSTCSQSCNTGTRTRTRICDSPSPSNGGSDCEGMNTETESCNTQLCPADLCASFDDYEFDPVTLICIKASQTQTNIFSAKTQCEEDNGALIKLDSQAKRDFLATVVAGDSDGAFFIGAIDATGNNEFEHLDGTPLVLLGMDTTFDSSGDCVRFVKATKEIDETDCRVDRSFICERDVTST